MADGVEPAPKRELSLSARPRRSKKKDVPGQGQPSTEHLPDAPKPPEDYRVPGVKPDPMLANGHHAEENAANAEKIEKKAAGMPPAMKEAMDNMRAAAETAVLVSTMGQVGDRNGRWKFLNTLDRIDDPTVRAKVKQQFEAQTKQSLDHFIETAPWHSKRDREQAQDMVSSKRDHTEDSLSKLAKENPAEYEKKRVQAIQWASLVLQTTRKDDVDHDSDAKPIFDTLGPRTPEEIELIRAEIRKQTGGRTAYQEIDKSLSGGTEDEALAGLKGDKINAVAAGIRNADGNVKRMEELLLRLGPEEIKQLNVKAPDVAIIAIHSVPPGQREQIGDLITGNRAKANAAHIADLFKDPKDGFEMDGIMPTKQSLANVENRKTENILKELRGMSAEDIRAARDAWNSDPDNKGTSWSEMIERRFKDGDSNTLMRIRALADGNKVEERAYALREGMREQNQTMIEEALANPDLDSADPVKKAIAHSEKLELEARVMQLDVQAQKASALMTGKDPNAAVAHSMKEQLSDYYKQYGEKVPEPKDFDSMMDLMKGEEVVKKKRTKEAETNNIASTELHDKGQLSKVTQIQRAEKKGDLETKAQLLENVQDASERKKIEDDYKARTKKSVYDDPRAAEFAAVARFKKEFQGDDRPLEEIQKETADEGRNANEHRIHNVDLYGAKSERSADLEYHLQKEQFDRQHSDSLEASEMMREMYGGNLGTEDLARHQLENMNEMFVESSNPFDMTPRTLKDGVSPDEFKARDKAVTSTLELQRAEKIKHGERLAMAFSTIAKIAALLAGQPHLVFLIDAAAGLTEMAIKSSVMGSDYDSSLDEKMFGLTMAVDALTMGAGKYFSGAASKLDDVVAAERAGANAATEMAEQAVTSEAKKEIAQDAVKQVAKGEAKLAGGIAKSADDGLEGGMAMAKTEQAIAKVEGEVAETAAETSVDQAVKTLRRQEMGVNLGIGAANTVGAGMIQGEGTEDMAFGVLRGMFGSLLPVSINAKLDKLVGQGKFGTALKYGMNVLSDVTVGGNDLKFALAGAHGNHLQDKRARKAAGGGDDHHVMSQYAEEPTYRAGVDDDVPTVTKTASDPVDPHVLANGHNAEADHLVTSRSTETRVGTGADPVTKGGDEKHHRVATNSEDVSTRASEARAKLDPEARANHDAMRASAENDSQRALLDRALAAGATPHEIDQLRASMRGQSDGEILQQYTGAGLVQFYHQSCVPTAYQIALADVNPVYAMRLRNHPELMMQAQRNALIINDAMQTPRREKDAPAALKEQLQDPAIAARYGDPTTYSTEGSSSVGIEATAMTDLQLHKQLEQATGTKYDVITNDRLSFDTPGHLSYADGGVPHERIQAAGAAQLPVLFSMHNHEMVISGIGKAPDGSTVYYVTDPASGTTSPWPPSFLDAMPTESFTLPTDGSKVTESSGSGHGETRSGAQTDHPEVESIDVPPSTSRRPDGSDRDRRASAPPDNLDYDKKKAPSRETRGWSAVHADENAPHLSLIEQGHGRIPQELDQLVHPPRTPGQDAMLAELNEIQKQLNETMSIPANYDNDPAKLATLVEQYERMDQSRRNVERSIDGHRQSVARKNQPDALRRMTHLHTELMGEPSAEATAMAAAVPIRPTAVQAIEASGRDQDAVRTDIADFARLTGGVPNVQLEQASDRRAHYQRSNNGC
ncbi:MAG: hypothetical protein AB7O24_31360 [Kofleriaceae bacterium]